MIDGVLVTGGTGFVGNWMHETQPADVSAVYVGRQDLDMALKHEYRYIVHLAPIPIAPVIDCARRSGAKVLLASSGAVYQTYPNQYALDKRQAEFELQGSGLSHAVARLFTFTGRWLKWDNFAVGQFIRDGLKGEITILGSGNVVRSYMHGEDLGRWMWRILFNGAGVYDVGSDSPVTIRNLAREVRDNIMPRPKIVELNKIEYERQPYYVPDVTRARVELKLGLDVPFEDAIRWSVEEYLNDR